MGALSAAARQGTARTYGPWVYDRWVQKPAQNRSERTFFRLLDAAEGLLGARHWHEVSVQEIARRAEASVGSFYNRFTDKSALLHCLDDRLGDECERTIKGLVDEFEACPALVEDAPGIMISLLMRLCRERAGVIRALDMAERMAEKGAFTGLGPRFDSATDRLAAFLAAHHAGLEGYGAPAVAQAFRESFWLARERLLYGAKADEGVDDDAMHKALLRHFHASLEGWS